MATLTWTDVMLIGGVATVGFMLLSWWFSGIMGRKGWMWQAKNRPPRKAQAEAAQGPGEGDPKDARSKAKRTKP